jgi:hypothetical protein
MAIALQAEGIVEGIVGMYRIIGDGRCIADRFRPSWRRRGCVPASSKIKLTTAHGEGVGVTLCVRLETSRAAGKPRKDTKEEKGIKEENGIKEKKKSIEKKKVTRAHTASCHSHSIRSPRRAAVPRAPIAVFVAADFARKCILGCETGRARICLRRRS